MHGFHGGFEYAAREARRELLEEARERRLARLARPGRGLGERLAPALRAIVRLWEAVRGREDPEVAVDGVPDYVYLVPKTSEKAGTAVEIYLGAGGCVVRKIDLGTGASTDAFVADGPLRP